MADYREAKYHDRIAYGETLNSKVVIEGVSFGEEDWALFVIRDKAGAPVFHQTTRIAPDETIPGAYSFFLEIPHTISEQALPAGEYFWGIAVYRDAVFSPEGVPVDGVVHQPVARGTLEVVEAVAREEGLLNG
jgi:hypothetical protein